MSHVIVVGGGAAGMFAAMLRQKRTSSYAV